MTLPGVGALRRFNQSRMYSSCDIERFTSVRDQYGDVTQTWAVINTVTCFRLPLRGQELVLADRLGAEVNTKIDLPYGTDVNTDDRLVVDGRRYSIDYIQDISPEFQSYVGAFCRFIENVS